MAENTTIEQCLQELVAIAEQQKQLNSRHLKLSARIQDAFRKRIDRVMTQMIGAWWIDVSYQLKYEKMEVTTGRISAYQQWAAADHRNVRILLSDYMGVQSNLKSYVIERESEVVRMRQVGPITTRLPSPQEIGDTWGCTIEREGVFEFCSILRSEEDQEQVRLLAAKARSILANSERPGADWATYICTDVLYRPDLVPADLVVKQIKELSNGEN
jgi:hypothetical protein